MSQHSSVTTCREVLSAQHACIIASSCLTVSPDVFSDYKFATCDADQFKGTDTVFNHNARSDCLLKRNNDKLDVEIMFS